MSHRVLINHLGLDNIMMIWAFKMVYTTMQYLSSPNVSIGLYLGVTSLFDLGHIWVV